MLSRSGQFENTLSRLRKVVSFQAFGIAVVLTNPICYGTSCPNNNNPNSPCLQMNEESSAHDWNICNSSQYSNTLIWEINARLRMRGKVEEHVSKFYNMEDTGVLRDDLNKIRTPIFGPYIISLCGHIKALTSLRLACHAENGIRTHTTLALCYILRLISTKLMSKSFPLLLRPELLPFLPRN